MRIASLPRALTVVALLALTLLGAVVAAQQLNQGPSISLRPGSPQIVARGKQAYLEHCASCHGANLEGQPNWKSPGENGRLPAPPHDVTGHTWHHADAILIDIVKRGTAAFVGGGYESDMPGYADILSDDDIIAVLSFIKSRWPKDVRNRHDLLNRNAEN